MATEATFREEAKGCARPILGSAKDLKRLLNVTNIDMGTRVMIVDFTGGVGDVIIGLMRCGKAKGRTGSELILGQEGPEVTAAATATGLMRHQMDVSLLWVLFRIVVALQTVGPFGVNPLRMKSH